MPTLPPVYFERLLEDSPDIIVAVDRHGRIVFYNDGARTALGYRRKEVLGRHVEIFYPSLDEARSVMAAMRDPTLDSPGKVRSFQTTFVTRSGEQVAVAISGALIHDEASNEIGSIGFAKDLREIHRQDQLDTLSEISIGVAHEINNPLTAILNNLTLLEGEIRSLAGEHDCEVEMERLESIHGSVGKIQSIVNRIAEMAGAREYDTREYLPGTLMADLATDGATVDGGRASPATATSATPAGGVLIRSPRDEKQSRSGSELGHHPPAKEGRLAGLRVLVADDDLAVCHSVEEVLRAEGCHVEAVSSGLQARERIEQERFDLVLSDVVMPDIDGYDLFMFLREHRPETPVVLMTAFFYDRDHVLKRSKLAGLDGILYKKPVEPARLIEIVLERCGR